MMDGLLAYPLVVCVRVETIVEVEVVLLNILSQVDFLSMKGAKGEIQVSQPIN